MTRDRYSPSPDHDALINFVANEHIDWTAATENLYTTGSGRFDGGVGVGAAPITDCVTADHLFPILWFKANQNASPTTKGFNLFDGDESYGTALVPTDDDYFDLGESDKQWKDLYIDGVAYIDALGQNLNLGGYDLTNGGDIVGTSFNDIGLTSVADGFTIDGGTQVRQLYVTGAGITLDAATQTGWGTSLTHAGDNTQAHTDYLLNSGNDSSSGTITAAGFATAGDITIGEKVIHAGDADTYIAFDTNQQTYTAGGLNFLSYIKSGFPPSFAIFNVSSENIDFIVRTDDATEAINVDASANTLTLGVDTVMADAKNLVFDTTTGTEMATADNQKFAFHGATPIVKPTGVAVSAAGIHSALVSLGLIAV